MTGFVFQGNIFYTVLSKVLALVIDRYWLFITDTDIDYLKFI